MKKVIFALLAVLLVGSGVYFFVRPSAKKAEAETAKGVSDAEKVQKEISKIGDDAKLTAEQRDKISAALLQFHEEKNQIKKDVTNSSEAAARKQVLRDSLQTKIQTILSPEQYQIVMATLNKEHHKDSNAGK